MATWHCGPTADPCLSTRPPSPDAPTGQALPFQPTLATLAGFGANHEPRVSPGGAGWLQRVEPSRAAPIVTNILTPTSQQLVEPQRHCGAVHKSRGRWDRLIPLGPRLVLILLRQNVDTMWLRPARAPQAMSGPDTNHGGEDVSARDDRPLAVMLFDIDHFKQINDSVGHQMGDEILKRVARVGSEHLRAADIIARYGGEEFIVLLPGSTAKQSAVVADRIREAIAADAIETPAARVGATISVGLAEALPDRDTLEQLIRRADRALYEAKGKGRNCTVVASWGVQRLD